MAVPGANAKLGQGLPGGVGGLPGGLPLPGGGATGLAGGVIPVPQIPKSALGAASPSVAAPAALPVKIRDPGAAAAYRETHPAGGLSIQDEQNLINNSASTVKLSDAMATLIKVEKGQIKPARAAKLMQGLTPGDQGKLASLVGSHFARTGVSDRNVLKTLQTLQSLPAPDDAQPHDIITNFTHDASDLITGLPAGIGLAGAYLGKDTYNTLRGKPSSNFVDKIVKPVGHQLADTYSPLVHGDLGGFYKKFHAHPLGPILDAASIFSAGAGTVGRLGRAGEAISAARAGSTLVDDGATILYRGDKTPIHGEFDVNKSKNVEQNLGQGIYLTPQKDLAKGFGPHMTAVKVSKDTLSRVIDLDQKVTPDIQKAFSDAAQQALQDLKRSGGKDPYRQDYTLEPDEVKYLKNIAEGNHGPTVRDLLHQEGANVSGSWMKPEGLFDPVFQKAFRENLSKLGYTGLKNRFGEAGAMAGDVRIPHSEELALWNDKALSKARVDTGALADAAKVGAKVGAKVDEMGVPLSEWHTDNLHDLGGGVHTISALRDPKTGKVYSTLENHEALMQDLPEKVFDRGEQYTALVDKQGKVLRVNHADPHASLDGAINADPVAAKAISRQIEDKFNAGMGTKTGALADAAKLPADAAVDTIRGMNTSHAVDELGTPHLAFKSPTPEELKANPWMGKIVASTTPSGKSFHFGSGEHDDLWNRMEKQGVLKDGKIGNEPQIEGTVILDPKTGLPVKFNIGGDGERAGMSQPEIKALEAKGLKAAQAKVEHADSLPGNRIEPTIDDYGMSTFPDVKGGADLKAPPGASVGGHIASDIDPTTGLSKVQLAKAGIKGFAQGGPKGNLIDLYDAKRGITHEAEIQNYMQEIGSVLKDSDNLRVGRRGVGQVVKDVAADIRATRAEGKARPAEMAANLPGFISAGSTGRALSAGETALREASDMVRAGAIYLRPAYLPNNWAGNTFMNAVHQGAWAPLNLAKSLVINKHMDPANLAAMRKSMGTNPAEAVTTGTGRGYVSSLTQPIAHVMGTIADQPFRDAAFLHEARKGGYRTLKSVDDLFNKARMSEKAGAVGDTTAGDAALREIANMSRRAQEEIVKFGHMNETERSVIRNLVFVYSWMRGAGRYAGRFPLAHPIQTDLFNRLSGPGNQYTRSIMGGVPSFMAGSVPVGRDKNGNPIMVNPFSLNPLGTGLQIAQAAAGTADVIRDPKSFNKYAQNDVVGLLNPIANSYITARSGGQPMKKQLENTIAALALKRGLQHPGSGSIYPTSKAEAVGHFAIGSLYPRVADQAAITKALEHQNIGHPAAMIPQQIRDFKKATGQDIPPQLVSAYQGDLEAIQMQKDFQAHYADAHGASGFRNMPPQNKVEAALAYLTQHSHLPPQQIAQLKQGATQLTTDKEYSDYANSLWSMTGAGEYRRAWLDLMRSTKGTALTRKR